MSNFSKGNELYNTRNYSDAINYYKKALDNDECKCHSYYNAGVCYIKLKQYEKAIEMITKALELYQDSTYFFNLAYCYSMINNNSKALRYFNLAWALDNADIDCEKAISLILSKISK